MTPAQRETIERHFAAERIHDPIAAAATFLEQGSTYELAALGLEFHNREGVELQYTLSFQLIENLQAETLWQCESEDHFVQVARLTGKAVGELLGVPASGGDIDVPFVSVFRFKGDEMESERVWFDLDEFCRQGGIDVDQVRAVIAASAA